MSPSKRPKPLNLSRRKPTKVIIASSASTVADTGFFRSDDAGIAIHYKLTDARILRFAEGFYREAKGLEGADFMAALRAYQGSSGRSITELSHGYHFFSVFGESINPSEEFYQAIEAAQRMLGRPLTYGQILSIARTIEEIGAT